MPKEDHNAMLRKLLKNLPSPKRSNEKKVRLLVAGNTFESIGLLQTLEEYGGEIVIDDIDVGTRYYGSTVNENSDPLRALASATYARFHALASIPLNPG